MRKLKKLLALAMATTLVVGALATPEPVKADSWTDGDPITVYDEIEDYGLMDLQWNTTYSLSDIVWEKPDNVIEYTKSRVYRLQVTKPSDISIKVKSSNPNFLKKKTIYLARRDAFMELFTEQGKLINRYTAPTKATNGSNDIACISYPPTNDSFPTPIYRTETHSSRDTLIYKSLPVGTYYLKLDIKPEYVSNTQISLKCKKSAVNQVEKIYAKIKRNKAKNKSYSYKWTKVKGATKYQVKYNGKIYTTKKTKFTSKQENPSSYIYVRALKGKKKGPWTGMYDPQNDTKGKWCSEWDENYD